jgi:NAD(P)H dehydrogenase (quinone)
MRLAVHTPSRAPDIEGAQVATADFGDLDSLAEALHDGDRVFMVSMHRGPDERLRLHRTFIEAAAKHRVAHVVYLSFLAAGPDALFLHARSHGATEQMLRESGLPYTFIRNGMYADDIPGWFDAEGIDRAPGGNGRMSFSYRPELADVIAATVSEPGHEGKTYDITTPQAVSLFELTTIASDVTGDDYRYEPEDDAWWEARWRARGREEWSIEAGHTSYEALRRGEFDVVTDDYRTITGREPKTIAQIIECLANEMPLRTI